MSFVLGTSSMQWWARGRGFPSSPFGGNDQDGWRPASCVFMSCHQLQQHFAVRSLASVSRVLEGHTTRCVGLTSVRACSSTRRPIALACQVG